MTPASDTRDLLARTGRLFTQEPDDVGHISDFWRARILDLCERLDSAPLDIADRLREECSRHEQAQAALADREESVRSLRVELASKTEDVERALERSRAAVLLVEDALPRMQTLNNAMSPDWLRRAAEFLEA